MIKTKKELLGKLVNVCELGADGFYHSKKGKDYKDALNDYFSGSKNKNDIPFTIEDIKSQPTISDFSFLKNIEDHPLIFVGTLKAKELLIDYDCGKRENEKIIFTPASSEVNDFYQNIYGVAYMITCVIDGNEYIIKIGSSSQTFADRLGSYNSGTLSNIRTASTTNIKILQSFVLTREIFKLYLCDCSSENHSYKWGNQTSPIIASSMSKGYEECFLRAFKEQFKFKPLANIQANVRGLAVVEEKGE